MKEYYKKAKENKTVYQGRARDYLQGGKDVGDSLVPYDPTMLVCALCGKIFKTEGGYKYHIQNVCITEMETQGLPSSDELPPLNR